MKYLQLWPFLPTGHFYGINDSKKMELVQYLELLWLGPKLSEIPTAGGAPVR